MIERRSLAAQTGAGALTVRIPYNSLSEDSGAEILALWNHSSDKPLARRSNGSLELSSDAGALSATIKLDGTTWAEDAQRSIAAGTVKGASFGFSTNEDRWDRVNGEWQRTLLDAVLIEVSPTPAPAYSQSSAESGK
jgi:uncharacterized protein